MNGPVGDAAPRIDPHSLPGMTLQLGILLALLCAFASNLAFLYKHRGARAAPQVDIAHPLRSAAALWSSKWFAIGMLVGGGAWVLHVAALALAPLSIVQAVLAGGVVLIAVMADRMFGFESAAVSGGASASPPSASSCWRSRCRAPAARTRLLGHRDDRLRGRAARRRRAADHRPARRRRAPEPPRRHARRRVGRPLRRLQRRRQGAHRAGRRTTASWRSSAPGPLVALVASASPPSTPRRAASRTARPSRSSRSPAPRPTISCIAGGIIVFGDPMPADPIGIVVQAVAFLLVIVASALTPAPRSATSGGRAPAGAAA